MASQVCKRRVKATFPVLREFHIHLERENSLANNDSVLPLYVPDTDELEEVVFIINVTIILKKTGINRGYMGGLCNGRLHGIFWPGQVNLN